jgi:hypothetical protein
MVAFRACCAHHQEDILRLSAIYEDWWVKGTPFASACLRIDPQSIAGRERVPAGASRSRLYISAFSKLPTGPGSRKQYAANEPAVVFNALSESPVVR